MSSPIISIENLGKRYHLGHSHGRGGSYRRLSEELIAAMKRPLWRRRPAANGTASSEEFWALRDVSLEVEEGEVVGIIGRNGAGKSTLLKTLIGIAPPETGSIRLAGEEIARLPSAPIARRPR